MYDSRHFSRDLDIYIESKFIKVSLMFQLKLFFKYNDESELVRSFYTTLII